MLTSEKNMVKATRRTRIESRSSSIETDATLRMTLDRDAETSNDTSQLFGSFNNQLYFLISEQFVSDFLEEY
jgi:hypothetical protein